MKKINLLLALCLAGPVCFSQSNNEKIPAEPIEQSKFSFGVVGGYGHSFVEPYVNNTFMSSWDAGLSMVYAPGVHWGAGADLTYSSEGVKLKTGDFTSTTRLDYLRIPVKAIYFCRTYDKDFRPKVSIGPTFGFLVNDHGNPDFNTFDFGASASLGFNYRLLRAVWFNMDATYYQGFTDMYNYNGENDRNGNIRLNIGVSFGL